MEILKPGMAPLRWNAMDVQGEKGLNVKKRYYLQFFVDGEWIDVPTITAEPVAEPSVIIKP